MGNGAYESKVDSLIAKTRQWTDENGNARILTRLNCVSTTLSLSINASRDDLSPTLIIAVSNSLMVCVICSKPVESAFNLPSLSWAWTIPEDAQGKPTGKSFQYISGTINDNGVNKQLDTISTKADNLQIKLNKLKASYSDINSSRPIKDSNNISVLSQQYDKVFQAIENIRNADNATFSSMVSNAQREIKSIKKRFAINLFHLFSNSNKAI